LGQNSLRSFALERISMLAAPANIRPRDQHSGQRIPPTTKSQTSSHDPISTQAQMETMVR
jgi:hypothetical protein